MATTETKIDERKLLAVPDGASAPTAKLLKELMGEVGYDVAASTSKADALQMVYEGPRGRIGELRKAVAGRMGYTVAPAAATRATDIDELTVAEMRDRIARTGYQETIPRKADDVKALFESIVVAGVIPHAYPTGTKLADMIDKPWTMLLVTPDDGQPTVQVELQARSLQSASVAAENIAAKANRRGQLVALGELQPGDGEGVYTATATIIPADNGSSDE